MSLNRTPLHATHQALGGRLVPFSGWEMPLQYTSIREEQLAVRHVAGAFDVSHMGRYELAGAGAETALQRILTNDVGGLPAGHALYSLMCREDGGVIDDVIVYRHSGDRFTVVVNAANRAADWEWIEGHRGSAAELRDRSDELALIAFQGPRAGELASLPPVSEVPAFGFVAGATVLGIRCELAGRTGYTGEDGWELMVPAGKAVDLWNRLLATDPGVRPCGLGARDVCRLEAGLRLYGNDMDLGTNPYEAGLGWTVKLDKGEFIGRTALAEIKSAGPKRTTLGIRCLGRAIPRHGAEVSKSGEVIGEVTSGTWSFFLEQGIGMGRLAAGRATAGDRVEVATRGEAAAAEVVRLPFYRAPAREAVRSS